MSRLPGHLLRPGPPVHNGHNICTEHAPKLRNKCPVCRTSYGRYSCRNLLAENLAALEADRTDQEIPMVIDRRRFWDVHPELDRNVGDDANETEDEREEDDTSSGESSESDESPEINPSSERGGFFQSNQAGGKLRDFLMLILSVGYICLFGDKFMPTILTFMRLHIDVSIFMSNLVKMFSCFVCPASSLTNHA
ncbi:uncharacterized protein LOC118438549 [Folsomia candida]|uniref:uncharacterized protein LOC118438549 n=1 Tax=Folsomia candida TaxID=158441 RepID=UPI00160524B0|nr:uncharacterized protein LOC118438549 [Folsomia candida]